MIAMNLLIESLLSRSQDDSDLALKTLMDVNRILFGNFGLLLKLSRRDEQGT